MKSLKANSILNLIKTLMGLIFPLITFPYASRVLLAEGIGTASYVITIISYFQMISALGINTYAISYGSKIRDDKEKLNRFVSEIFYINLLTMMFSYLLFILVLVSGVFKNYNYLLVLCSLNLFFITLGMDWLYSILEEYRYITFRSILFQFISLVLLFLIVKSKNDVQNYILLNVISQSGSGLLNFIHKRKYVKINLKSVKFRSIKKHIKPILIIFSMTISSTIYMNSDIFMIGLFKGDVATGLYSAAQKINYILVSLICSISTVLLPRLSYHVERKEFVMFNNIVSKALNYMIILIIPLMFGMIYFSDSLLYIISGDEFMGAFLTSKILILNLFLSPINNFLVYQILMPFNKEKESSISTFVGALTNVVLNIGIIPFLSYNGAAITTIIAEFIVFILLIYFTKNLINFKLVFNRLWQYIFCSLPILFFCNFFSICYATNIIIQFFVAILCFIIYILLLYVMKNEYISDIFDYLLIIMKKRSKDECHQ